MVNINIELTEAEHQTAKTVKAIYGMEWKEFFMKLVDIAIEKRGLNKEPVFKSNE